VFRKKTAGKPRRLEEKMESDQKARQNTQGKEIATEKELEEGAKKKGKDLHITKKRGVRRRRKPESRQKKRRAKAFEKKRSQKLSQAPERVSVKQETRGKFQWGGREKGPKKKNEEKGSGRTNKTGVEAAACTKDRSRGWGKKVERKLSKEKAEDSQESLTKRVPNTLGRGENSDGEQWKNAVGTKKAERKRGGSRLGRYGV